MSSYKKEFEDLIEKPDYFHDQVLKAQEKIIPNFTQKTISQKWLDFFTKLN